MFKKSCFSRSELLLNFWFDVLKTGKKIFRKYLNKYYSMISIWCYYLVYLVSLNLVPKHRPRNPEILALSYWSGLISDTLITFINFIVRLSFPVTFRCWTKVLKRRTWIPCWQKSPNLVPNYRKLGVKIAKTFAIVKYKTNSRHFDTLMVVLWSSRNRDLTSLIYWCDFI